MGERGRREREQYTRSDKSRKEKKKKKKKERKEIMATSAVEVTWEDQKRINSFGRLHNRKVELLSHVKAQEKLAEDLEDAGNEIMLSDDEIVKYTIGECFVHMERDAAEERLTAASDEANEELRTLKQELDEINSEMAILKKELYAKFKDQ